jgi:hypothetical protein
MAVRLSKTIPVTGREGPQCCETPYFPDNRLIDGGEVSLTRRPPFTSPGRFLVAISVRGRVDNRVTVRLEGSDQLKNQMTSSGIEPPILRLVAQ